MLLKFGLQHRRGSSGISGSGIALESIGYMTLAGGATYFAGRALLYGGNENYPGPWTTERGTPWNPNIEGPNNRSLFPKGNPKAPDWMEWIIYPVGGWTAGHEFYKQWKGPDIPDISAPTTTDKTPQVGPKRE